MKFLGRSSFLGTASAYELLKEQDEDVLLAIQAANAAAAQLKEQEYERLAGHIISKLSESFKSQGS